MTREDGRTPDQLRQVTMTRRWLDHAEGSCLVEFGKTRVLVAVSATEGVPRWRKGSGLGWLTAEYAMLPRATHTRSDRESVKGRVGGRTHEISRLVGRSLRGAVDLSKLGENSLAVDCDVLQADGGTRTAAISGAWVALRLAVDGLMKSGAIVEDPIMHKVGAISCGICNGVPVLDLDYSEDSCADADANFVLLEGGKIAEVQATAEGACYDEEGLLRLLRLARIGCEKIYAAQAEAVGR
jgi:ribonuclease PH